MSELPPPPRISLRRTRARQPAGVPGVPSPCVSICRMLPATGLCQGCWRTLDEIAGWGRLADADKLVIWSRVEARQAAGQPAA